MSIPVPYQFLAEALSAAGLSAAFYMSTNIDNLILLSAYSARAGCRPVFIKLTFICACLIVLLASVLLAQAADILASRNLCYLGLIPMALGFYALIKLSAAAGGGSEERLTQGGAKAGFSAYAGLVLLLSANRGDSFRLMVPLFADLKPSFVFVSIGAILAAAATMTILASFLVRQLLSKPRIEKLAARCLPDLLIGIGLLIFTDRPADVFVE